MQVKTEESVPSAEEIALGHYTKGREFLLALNQTPRRGSCVEVFITEGYGYYSFSGL